MSVFSGLGKKSKSSGLGLTLSDMDRYRKIQNGQWGTSSERSQLVSEVKQEAQNCAVWSDALAFALSLV